MPFRKVQTIYVYRTFNDGTVGFFVFDQAKLQPNKPWTEQLDQVLFADRKPFTEMLADAAGIVMAVSHASGVLAQELRDAKIRVAAEEARAAPVDAVELTKLASFFEGISLDPSDDLRTIQEKLQKRDEDDQHEVRPEGT